MDNTELQRILLADPYSQHPTVLKALSEDEQLRQFVEQLRQQEAELLDALQTPVPPMLAEKLLQLPTQQSSGKPVRDWLAPLALAASIALISVLGVQMYQHTGATDLGSHALAHVYHEHEYLLRHAAAQPLDDVNLKLADFSASLQPDWQDEIIYARYCTFQGVRSLHLAVKTADGYATVFIVPKEAELKFVKDFNDSRYKGVTLAMAKANVVVVSDNSSDLKALPKKLTDKLIFSA